MHTLTKNEREISRTLAATREPQDPAPAATEAATPAPETGQGGGFPLWAVAADRCARAVSEALELGLYDHDPAELATGLDWQGGFGGLV